MSTEVDRGTEPSATPIQPVRIPLGDFSPSLLAELDGDIPIMTYCYEEPRM